MVLGIGEGSIEIALEKNTYSPGETIRGRATLRLNSPKKARGLKVDFYGEYSTRSRGKRKRDRIFQVRQKFPGSRVYNNGETFDFVLQLPSMQFLMPDNAVGDMMSAFAIPRATAYFVHASLDAPMEFDINSRVQVSLINVPTEPRRVPESEMSAMDITLYNLKLRSDPDSKPIIIGGKRE